MKYVPRPITDKLNPNWTDRPVETKGERNRRQAAQRMRDVMGLDHALTVITNWRFDDKIDDLEVLQLTYLIALPQAVE